MSSCAICISILATDFQLFSSLYLLDTYEMVFLLELNIFSKGNAKKYVYITISGAFHWYQRKQILSIMRDIKHDSLNSRVSHVSFSFLRSLYYVIIYFFTRELKMLISNNGLKKIRSEGEEKICNLLLLEAWRDSKLHLRYVLK